MSAALAAALLALAAAEPGTELRCEERDAVGRRLRTCFDSENGLELGVGALARGAGGVWVGPELSAVLRFHTDRDSASRDGSLWLNDHRLLAVRGALELPHRELTFTAYEGVFRRHVADGFVLIPTASPIRLPFPFDVGLAFSTARFERRVYEGPGGTLEVARAALMLDPLRQANGRTQLAFGPAVSYGVRHDGEALHHELCPMSGAQLLFSHESEAGWWSVRLAANAGWVFEPAASASRLRARGTLDVDRLLFSVNDQPIYVRLTAAGTLNDAGPLARSEWRAGLGLVLNSAAN